MSRLPPFFALRAMEAAARHRSYSRAAAELSVTHGAVSQQIRRLEAELGARLFERRGNAMIPSPQADELACQVGAALDILRNAVEAFGTAAERDPLVLSLDPQFANRWLPPRLPRLSAHPAGANLEIRVEERLADFVTDGVDLAVRYGLGRWPGVQIQHLFQEIMFPVCRPEFARGRSIRSAADLLKSPLLRQRHQPWRLWFEAFGLTAQEPAGVIYDDSVLLLDAAAQGLGVALARGSLAEQDLKTGRLVRLLPEEVTSTWGFYVVWRGDSRRLARIHALRDWLMAETAGRRVGQAAREQR
jgi:LysR family transcriptional regulator, glycine cleavage system transcriptional activator